MLDIVPLNRDLVQATVDEITKNSSNDFSHCLVVSPSKRFLVFLKDALNKKIDHSYFPPELLTIDQFVVKLFDMNVPGFREINEIEAALQTYKTVRDVFREHVYAGGIVSQHFPDFFPWALVIQKAIEELLVEGERISDINEGIFEEFIRLGEYHSGYKNFITKLPVVTEMFKKTLLEQKRYTRGITYRVISELAKNGSLKIPSGKEFIFSGLGGLNASEKKLLTFIFDGGKARLLIRSDRTDLKNRRSPFFIHHQTLEALHLSLENPGEAVSWNQFAGKVNLYCFPNIESQMVKVADILDAALQSENDPEKLKKIAIILPESASLIPFVHGTVSRLYKIENEVPFNITLGYPFVRTPLYQLIRFIIKTAESREREMVSSKDYLNLIRHPYVKMSGDSQDEDEPLKRGIHLIEEIISQENLLYFIPAKMEEKVVQKLDRSPILTSELKERISAEIKNLHDTFLPDRNLNLEELGQYLKQSVLALEKNTKSHLFLGEYITTAVRALDCLIQFARENESEVGFAEFSSLTSLISHYFSGIYIYFEGSPLKGIQVMGMLESRGLGFDEVIVLDVLEGVLPQRLKYDPLLPFDIRKTFGVRNYTEWESLFSLNFFSLLGAAKKIHLLWIDNPEGMDKTEKSRFVERIFYEMEKEGNPSAPVMPNSCQFNIEARVLKQVNKTEAIGKAIDQLIFSPSALEVYIHCPLRFYFSRILGLKEKEELSTDPDVGELGTLIHRVLEQLYRNMDGLTDPEQASKHLHGILELEFQNRGFSTSSGLGRIQSWVIREKLNDFLIADLQRLKEGSIQLVGFEEQITAGVTRSEGSRQVTIRGRIDRIEKENEIVRLIDYKTGHPFTAHISKRLKEFKIGDIHHLPENEYLDTLKWVCQVYKSFQMLLYTLLYKCHSGIAYETIDAAYIFLKPAENFFRPVFIQTRSGDQISAEDKTHIMDNFSHNLLKIIEDIFHRDTFLANDRDSAYCKYCPFKIPCGNF